MCEGVTGWGVGVYIHIMISMMYTPQHQGPTGDAGAEVAG